MSHTNDLYSKNGQILPRTQAVVPIDTIESMYGFGVYESLKVRNGILYFVDQHIDRLLHSARSIALSHSFSPKTIETYLREYIEAIGASSTNIKALLLGGEGEDGATLLLFAVAPFYPKKEWYRDGVAVYSYQYERWMPQVKSLNMLPSYYYYSDARKKGGYDALFVDKEENIREGSRTNFYVLQGTTIISPPKSDILYGVTMMTLEKILKNSEFTIIEQPIPYDSLQKADAIFLSSTSSKILPISSIDDTAYPPGGLLKEIIRLYSERLDGCEGVYEKL